MASTAMATTEMPDTEAAWPAEPMIAKLAPAKPRP
jgi:hypothetical protein